MIDRRGLSETPSKKSPFSFHTLITLCASLPILILLLVVILILSTRLLAPLPTRLMPFDFWPCLSHVWPLHEVSDLLVICWHIHNPKQRSGGKVGRAVAACAQHNPANADQSADARVYLDHCARGSGVHK